MNNIQVLVGERIAECRKRVGINQTEFANKLNKSLRTVQKYESGEIDMPLSMLAEISKILNVSMNYLIGYNTSHIKLESVSDVLAYIFELDRKKEIEFDIDIKKSDMGEWNCSLIFDGKNANAKYNAEICLVMETLHDNREALKTYWMGYPTYDAWEEKTIDYHKKGFLSDKERELLETMDMIKKRNALDKLKLEKMLAEKEARNTNSSDDE